MRQMEIIKEWYGKSGILARLYKIPEGIFLDYKNCKQTSRVYVIGGIVQMQMSDVPKKYEREISEILRRRR